MDVTSVQLPLAHFRSPTVEGLAERNTRRSNDASDTETSDPNLSREPSGATEALNAEFSPVDPVEEGRQIDLGLFSQNRASVELRQEANSDTRSQDNEALVILQQPSQAAQTFLNVAENGNEFRIVDLYV